MLNLVELYVCESLYILVTFQFPPQKIARGRKPLGVVDFELSEVSS